VAGTFDLRTIEPAGVPSAVRPLLKIMSSASCIVVLIVLNRNIHPMIAPADIIVEFVLMVMSDVPEMLLDADKITLPPTVSLALTIRFPVYPVVINEISVFVAAPTVHCPLLVPVNTTSSPAAGTPEGDQLAAVAQVEAVFDIQVFVGIVMK
jgi:hypothetical protein